VFAADEAIPFGLAAALWRATAGVGELEAAQVAARLKGLALVSPADGGASGMTMHDVVRDFLRGEVGVRRLAALHGMLGQRCYAGWS